MFRLINDSDGGRSKWACSLSRAVSESWAPSPTATRSASHPTICEWLKASPSASCAPMAVNRRRRCEIWVRSVISAPAGCSPRHSTSAMRTAGTHRFRLINSSASSSRCLRPPSSSRCPSSAPAASGPRMPNHGVPVGGDPPSPTRSAYRGYRAGSHYHCSDAVEVQRNDIPTNTAVDPVVRKRRRRQLETSVAAPGLMRWASLAMVLRRAIGIGGHVGLPRPLCRSSRSSVSSATTRGPPSRR